MNLGWQQIHRGMKLKRVVGRGGGPSGDREMEMENGGGGRMTCTAPLLVAVVVVVVVVGQSVPTTRRCPATFVQ
jgi:hypothetical protein